MKLNNKGYAITLIVFGILIVFVVVLSTLLITMNNSVKLNKTVKESVVENIQLSADTSGMSLTERIEQLESKLSDIDGNIIDTIYPVGSVYISTTDSTIGDVVRKFPNTKWEVYAQGRTLVGVGGTTDANGNALVYNYGEEKGSSIISLNTDNMPSHSHSYTPSGIVASTFSGSSSTTGIESAAHTHTVTYQRVNSSSGSTVLSQDNLPHRSLVQVYNGTSNSMTISGISWGATTVQPNSWVITSNYDGRELLSSPGAVGHNHSIGTYSSTVTSSGESVHHTHTVTAQGTVTSTFTGTASNTGSVGSGKSFSVQNPYITVYMYKRVN